MIPCRSSVNRDDERHNFVVSDDYIIFVLHDAFMTAVFLIRNELLLCYERARFKACFYLSYNFIILQLLVHSAK
jgi:hypothetical protein